MCINHYTKVIKKYAVKVTNQTDFFTIGLNLNQIVQTKILICSYHNNDIILI